MFNIYDVATAQKTILRRTPPDELPIPAGLNDSIARIFGEPLSPAAAVSRILQDVNRRGDPALTEWTSRIDNVHMTDFRLPASALADARLSLDTGLISSLEQAARRIEAFHRRQPLTSWLTQESGGTLGQLIRPIQRVGIYIPGGTAPLPSTVLMTAIPARVAGVKEIVLVTPPARGSAKANPAILATADLASVDEVYVLGGAQAIAALAYGTQSIRPVEKIFGPGNLFVTLAKQQVYGIVGIDGLAGPTETVVIADDTARADWAAADLLAQAEHDILASAILLTPSRILAEAVQHEIANRLDAQPGSGLSRAEIIAASLENRGGAVITRDVAEAVELSNAYAPEHLNLVVADPWRWVEKVTAAGGVFVGEHSYEVLGDYVAGPSHVMPTNGSAHFASPLNVWDFVRIVSLIALDPQTALQIGVDAARIAHAEGLDAHALSAEIRRQADS